MTLTMNVELPDTFSSELKHLLEALLQVRNLPCSPVQLLSLIIFPFIILMFVLTFFPFIPPPTPPPTPLGGAEARCDLCVFLQVQGREGGDIASRRRKPLVFLPCTLRICIIKCCGFGSETYFSL
jgi:hypothetical protein